VPLIIALLALLCGLALPHASQAAALERGTAIVDPDVLRQLDFGPFGLGRMLDPSRAADILITNAELFALPSMASVRKAIDDEFDRYVIKHRADHPNETIGVGASFDFQLFDRALLYSDDSRFALAGIVNRMDRAYLAPASCGEIRLIYRLVRTTGAAGEGVIAPRLPMTISLVLKAKGGDAIGNGVTVGCAEIARRWLDTGETPITPQHAASLISPGGPLELIEAANIDRIETNLQIAHAPKSAIRDFRTDYLLKLFHYNGQSKAFEEAPLENQIDRDRISADKALGREFGSWLLDPDHLSELDRGTVVIPERFLARGAIAATPAGFAPSKLQPVFGLVQPDGSKDAVIRQSDVVGALKKAADAGIMLQDIRSLGGFERRLNDMTCSGCHQTRGIGGFHFPGVDWMAAKPSNSSVVPASPHFLGDQTRRRDILAALREGRPPDYSRGFSDRPQLRGSAELSGTGYEDGWGAHCYRQQPGAPDNDKSFLSWTCAERLSCQPVDKASRIGMCFVENR
jgi:hypothetical protein